MNKAKGKGKGKAQVAEKAKARALARHNQFREQQREFRDYFAYFRRGKEKRWDEERREPVFSRYRVPRPGRWLGIAHDRRGDLAPPDPDLLDQGLLRVYGHQAEVVDEADDIDDLRIQRRAAEFAKLLKPHKIVFNKVLGWGGQGLALLFDILDLKNEKNEDQWTRVVVKCALKIDHDDYTVDESKWHKELRRAKHIVQSHRFKPPGFAERYQTRSTTKRQGSVPGREAVDDVENMLVLQFLGLGNLSRWIAKTHTEDTKFPDKYLWLIAQCLFKGVIAMAHPPAQQPNFNNNETGEIDEVLPPPHMPLKMSRDLIHFDIDPTNVLVGDFGHDPYHAAKNIPIFKISDFGLMEYMRDQKTNQRLMSWVWETRKYGKPWYLTPEQFTKEWDFCKGLPAAKPSTTVAGLYDWRSNLFQFGLLLWCIITKCHPPKRVDPQVFDTVFDTKTGRQRYLWSYGTFLLSERYDEIDIDLRELAVKCMMERPADRPRMREIESLIRRKTSDKTWPVNEQDDEWIRAFFTVPEPPMPKPMAQLEDFLADRLNLNQYVRNEKVPDVDDMDEDEPKGKGKGKAPAATPSDASDEMETDLEISDSDALESESEAQETVIVGGGQDPMDYDDGDSSGVSGQEDEGGGSGDEEEPAAGSAG